MISLFRPTLLATLLLISPTVRAEAETIKMPPVNAEMGVKRGGIQIGLWSEKAEYHPGEKRNAWVFSTKAGNAAATIGVNGKLYRNSFLYVTNANDETTKLPIAGPIDGMTDPSSFFGGISRLLSELPAGSYRLIWKTDDWESNTIEITIR